MKRRVLVVLSYYYPYTSGVSEYARLLVEGLSDTYDVTVLTGRHERSLPLRETVESYCIERADVLTRLHKGYLSLDLVHRFRKLIASADLVNFHLPMLDAAWLCLFVPKSKPILSTYQCDVQAVGGILDRVAVGAMALSCRYTLRRSARIFVTSMDYAMPSKALKPFRSRLVEGFAPIKGCAHAPIESFGEDVTNVGEFRVGFLGRFVREKGIDVLLDAVASIIGALPRVRLVLAGEHEFVVGGSIYDEIRAKIGVLGDRVEVLGRLPELDLAGFYRSLDVFVLPSVNAYEAFGMVQIEAMLQGTPVIASDMRGVRVPVKLTGSGYIVPPGDAAALSRALLQVARGRRFVRHEVAARARAQFCGERFMARYLREIDSLTARRAQG